MDQLMKVVEKYGQHIDQLVSLLSKGTSAQMVGSGEGDVSNAITVATIT